MLFSLFCFFSLQKTLRDKELESLQVKVQRLEKLCRALQIERNELSKKVTGLVIVQDETDTEEGSPAHQNSPEQETPPTTCSQPCHCGPELEAEAQREVCSAQDWGFLFGLNTPHNFLASPSPHQLSVSELGPLFLPLLAVFFWSPLGAFYSVREDCAFKMVLMLHFYFLFFIWLSLLLFYHSDSCLQKFLHSNKLRGARSAAA